MQGGSHRECSGGDGCSRYPGAGTGEVSIDIRLAAKVHLELVVIVIGHLTTGIGCIVDFECVCLAQKDVSQRNSTNNYEYVENYAPPTSLDIMTNCS